MEDIEELLLDEVLEKGVVDIIMDYKYQLEHREKFVKTLYKIHKMDYKCDMDSSIMILCDEGKMTIRDYSMIPNFIIVNTNKRYKFVPLLSSGIKDTFYIDFFLL